MLHFRRMPCPFAIVYSQAITVECFQQCPDLRCDLICYVQPELAAGRLSPFLHKGQVTFNALAVW